MSDFQPLEVVDRGSGKQPQVVENLNKLTKHDKGQYTERGGRNVSASVEHLTATPFMHASRVITPPI